MLAALFAGSAHAADISIVLDDSAGMCGYLSTTDSGYRQLLQRLTSTIQQTGASVEVHRLSQLGGDKAAVGARDGQAMRRLEEVRNIAPGTCGMMTSSTSPLHLMHKANGEKLTLMVSDMIFDLGPNGALESSYLFVNELSNWLNSVRNKGTDSFFNASTGIIGLKSKFSGKIYTQRATTVNFQETVERPFYVFWKSTDNQLAAKVLKDLAAATSAVGVGFSPYLGTTSDFSFARPAYTADILKNNNLKPLVVYEFMNRKARYEAEKGSILPGECFKSAISVGAVAVGLDTRCGKPSNTRNEAFVGVENLHKALILIPANSAGAIERTFSAAQTVAGQDLAIKLISVAPGTPLLADAVTEKDRQGKPTGKNLQNFGTDANACANPLDCWAPRNVAEALAKSGGRFITLEIQRGNKKLVFSKHTDTKMAIASGAWKETFAPVAQDEGNRRLSAFADGWGTTQEPLMCGNPSICPQNSKTVGLGDFLRTVAGRLNSGNGSVDSLNQEAGQRPIKARLQWLER